MCLIIVSSLVEQLTGIERYSFLLTVLMINIYPRSGSLFYLKWQICHARGPSHTHWQPQPNVLQEHSLYLSRFQTCQSHWSWKTTFLCFQSGLLRLEHPIYYTQQYSSWSCFFEFLALIGFHWLNCMSD